MTSKDNILQELKELNSNLAGIGRQDVYTVPVGYFDGLATQVMNRIKAMNSSTATEDPIAIGLDHLSPMLNKISRQVPYTVPQNYFDELAENVLTLIHTTGQAAKEELESISPLLSGLKKQMPFAVPQGYFETLSSEVAAEENKQPVKIISFTKRKWFRYAAAAVLVAIFATAGLVYQHSKNAIDPVEQPYAWVKKSVKKIDAKDIDAFVKLADEDLPGQADVAITPANTAEIKELMKDVSDKEIQDFLNETPDPESNTTDEEVMTN